MGVITIKKKFSNIVYLARDIAYHAFLNKVDHGGNAYIFHLVSVAGNCTDKEAQAAGYLHDVLEDTDITADDLLKDGIPVSVVETVQLLTRTQDETYAEYLEKLKSDPIAKEVKLADLADNMNLDRLNDSSDKSNFSLLRRYKKAVIFLES